MKRVPSVAAVLLVFLVALLAAPSGAAAVPTLTLTPYCSTPQSPYGVLIVLTGAPPNAQIEATLTWADGGLGPAFVRTDANGEFRFTFPTSGPLGLFTASGFVDLDEDQIQDPGEPTFEDSIQSPCETRPLTGGTVRGSADTFLRDSSSVHVSLDVRSGSFGQNPSGTVRLTTSQGEVTGTATCVGVKGLIASIGVALRGTLPGGASAAVIHVAEFSAVGGHDLVAIGPVDPAPSECPFPVGAGPEISSGDIVVTQAPPDPPLPTSKDQCKNGGWRDFPGFKNEGDCVSFVATGGKSPPGS